MRVRPARGTKTLEYPSFLRGLPDALHDLGRSSEGVAFLIKLQVLVPTMSNSTANSVVYPGGRWLRNSARR